MEINMIYFVQTKRQLLEFTTFDEAFEHAKAENGVIYKASMIVDLRK
jgi:hypothetical protein